MVAQGTQAEQETHLWDRYEITLRFIDEIAAGRPASGDLVERHMELFRHQATNVMKLAFITEGEVTEDVMQDYIKGCSTVFPADEVGIYLRGFQANAMLKDAAQRTKDTMKKKGLGNILRDGGLHFPHKYPINARALNHPDDLFHIDIDRSICPVYLILPPTEMKEPAQFIDL